MIRLREIDDEALREKLRAAIAARRGMHAAAIPDWWEMDDADLTDLLHDLDEAPPHPDDEEVDKEP
jgi:hypothetical protein